MRKSLLFILFVLSLSVNAQTKKTGLFTEHFGSVFLFQEKAEFEDGKVAVTTTLLFQDGRFTQISNPKYIYLHTKDEVELFIKDLESALSYSKTKENSVMEYGDKKLYQIDADARSGRITLWSQNKDGLNFIPYKKAVKMLEALKSIKDNHPQ